MDDQIPSPENILRGHKAAVHAARFIRNDERLVTGDADGYVVVWDLTIMRARAVWRAHENAILGMEGWGNDKIITHGRDHRLVVWQLDAAAEDLMSTVLPLDPVSEKRPDPWLLHLLEVNTMNFCSFSCCQGSETLQDGQKHDSDEMLVAVPNTLASEAIDIYSLPAQTRIHTIRPGHKNGMAMCLSLLQKDDQLVLIAAFENGFASVHVSQNNGNWITTYRAQAHNQPVLSMDVHPSHEFFYSSSADSLIAKHPMPLTQQEIITAPSLAAEGPRVVEITDEPVQSKQTSLLSASLKANTPETEPAGNKTVFQEWRHVERQANTKHSGQQSLRIRSDGKILATAGWDGNVRVYSARTLKELAVLQWHKAGCYAVAFSGIDTGRSQEGKGAVPAGDESQLNGGKGLVGRGPTAMTVKGRRLQHATTAHWTAAGSKDGKVSLWDIY